GFWGQREGILGPARRDSGASEKGFWGQREGILGSARRDSGASVGATGGLPASVDLAVREPLESGG
ncbi:MAG TPA: hypothetical protein P5316_03125, partial [Phycisphaerae bacterium]|nr:hypothetical protein [Phycisphaerae bacterium]